MLQDVHTPFAWGMHQDHSRQAKTQIFLSALRIFSEVIG
jgi:hypothetical protein